MSADTADLTIQDVFAVLVTDERNKFIVRDMIRAVGSGQLPLVLEALVNRPNNILIAGAAVLVSVLCRPLRQLNSHDGSAAEQLFLQAVPGCKGRVRGSRGSDLDRGRSDWKQALERIRIRSNDF